MKDRILRGKTVLAMVMALSLVLLVAACGEDKEEPAADSGGSASAKKDCGKVVLNEQAWAGSTANTYIAKAVLEDELGCDVEVTKIAEIPVFQAMADGKVDAVLEDWQHVDEYKKYIDGNGIGRPGRAARRGGPHRLVHPEVPHGREPGLRDLGGPRRARRTCSRRPSRATRACSSAATRATCRRTRS